MSGLNTSDKIFVAGHNGLLGSAIKEVLLAKGYKNLLLRSSKELDLRNQAAVGEFFNAEKPDVVFLAAAKVGGIYANNTFRADFIGDNLQIQTNVILSARANKTRRLVFMGSSCIYPRACPQPMKEEYLLTGELEYTNRPYAIAKIAGLELVNCIRQQDGLDWFSVMPTNLYGPGDNYHPENSHVLPALLRRFEEARRANLQKVAVWGSGTPRREFMYSVDCARAIVHLAERQDLGSVFEERFKSKWSHVNIGVGQDISIAELAKLIAEVVGYRGMIVFDDSKPDGTLQKLQDTSLLKDLGFEDKVTLEEGLKMVLKDYNLTRACPSI